MGRAVLEQIGSDRELGFSGNTCKMRVLARGVSGPEEQLKCSNCPYQVPQECPNYVPVSRTGIPVRYGHHANRAGVVLG